MSILPNALIALGSLLIGAAPSGHTASQTGARLETMLPVQVGDEWERAEAWLRENGTECIADGGPGAGMRVFVCAVEGVRLGRVQVRQLMIRHLIGMTLVDQVAAIAPMANSKCAPARQELALLLGQGWSVTDKTAGQWNARQVGVRDGSLICANDALITRFSARWPTLPVPLKANSMSGMKLTIATMVMDRVRDIILMTRGLRRTVLESDAEVAEFRSGKIKLHLEDFRRAFAGARKADRSLSQENRAQLEQYEGVVLGPGWYEDLISQVEAKL